MAGLIHSSNRLDCGGCSNNPRVLFYDALKTSSKDISPNSGFRLQVFLNESPGGFVVKLVAARKDNVLKPIAQL
ncbi:MAG: hypothetical protein ACI9HK_004085 [Pirellulaceae bacterium]|jgi:hypothetical protein